MGIASMELLGIASAMATVASSITFGWGSMVVNESANPGLRFLAKTLVNHEASNLHLHIEGHGGLEGRYHLPFPGQAHDFALERSRAVALRLKEEAAAAEIELSEDSFTVTSFGFSRPLVWAFRSGYGVDAQFIDSAASGRNRRVELYLQCGAFVVPRRRARSSVPVQPGKPPLTDLAPGENDALGEEEEQLWEPGESDDGQMVAVELADGRVMDVPISYLRRMGFFDDEEVGEEMEEGEGLRGPGPAGRGLREMRE